MRPLKDEFKVDIKDIHRPWLRRTVVLLLAAPLTVMAFVAGAFILSYGTLVEFFGECW